MGSSFSPGKKKDKSDIIIAKGNLIPLCFRAAVVHALGVLILTRQQGIGDGVGTLGDGGFGVLPGLGDAGDRIFGTK